MLSETVKDYLLNTQFHGFKFLAESGRHWTERLFWLVCVCLAWYATFLLIRSSLDGFENNAISFGTETTYLKWNTTMFAVTVCEEDNMEKVFDVAEELYGEVHNFNLDEVIKDITYFKGHSYYIKESCFNGDLDCPRNGYKKIAEMVRSSCPEIFRVCRWMNKPFPCCEYFVPLETELGTCFSLNTIQGLKHKPFPLVSNLNTDPGTLYIELYIPSKIYVHAPEDVPHMSTISSEVFTAQMYIHKRRHYSVLEIDNDPEVKDISVRQRRCRFPEENYLNVYGYYSYSACLVECRDHEQKRLCNCTSHLTPKSTDNTSCDLDGLLCLTNHYVDFSVIITPWTNKKGLVCSCLPSCSEPEYNIIEQEEFGTDEDVAIAEFILDRLATDRFKRSVVRGKLDLVVSMGGTCGLFLGASLLSFVELIYYFTLRFYGTVWNKKAKTKNVPAITVNKLQKKNIFHLSNTV